MRLKIEEIDTGTLTWEHNHGGLFGSDDFPLQLGDLLASSRSFSGGVLGWHCKTKRKHQHIII